MTSKQYIELKIKKEGKGNQYEQAVRVTKTFATECGNAVVGNVRKDLLLTQLAHLQASIETLKVINDITSDELALKVNTILGIPNVVKEEVKETVAIKATPKTTNKTTSSRR